MADNSQLILHSAPRGSLYAEAFTAIEADLDETLEAFTLQSWPRRTAAGCGSRRSTGHGHGRLITCTLRGSASELFSSASK